MFIAMNRFHIARGHEAAFEAVWRNRESHLAEMPGFHSFHLLRGPAADDHTLYATHTMWASEDAFRAWTTSEQFRAAHANAPRTTGMYIGRPQFEGFVSVIEEAAVA